VNFIVTIEQALEDHFDICVTLADEKAMSLKNSPFRTVETLGEYICKRLEEKLQ
jgi:acyl carrier protein